MIKNQGLFPKNRMDAGFKDVILTYICLRHLSGHTPHQETHNPR